MSFQKSIGYEINSLIVAISTISHLAEIYSGEPISEIEDISERYWAFKHLGELIDFEQAELTFEEGYKHCLSKETVLKIIANTNSYYSTCVTYTYKELDLIFTFFKKEKSTFEGTYFLVGTHSTPYPYGIFYSLEYSKVSFLPEINRLAEVKYRKIDGNIGQFHEDNTYNEILKIIIEKK